MRGDRKRNWDAVYTSRHCPTGDAEATPSPSYLTATTERWAYLAREEVHSPELYDLRRDPGQQQNVASDHPLVVNRLQRSTVTFLRNQGAAETYIDRYTENP